MADAATIGQEIDAKIKVLEARIAVIEADAKTAWSDVKAWVVAQWPHAVTWVGATALAAKAGLIHIL